VTSAIPPTNILGTLSIGRRALLAHQSVLQTVGHNLANVATDGYTRQRAELVAQAGQGGVDVDLVRRLRDRFADLAVRTEQQALGKNEAQASLLQRLEGIFTETSTTGLAGAIDQFFRSFQDLTTVPTDPVARAAVKDAADRLASTFSFVRASLDGIKSDLTSQIQGQVSDINSLVQQISDVHQTIQNTKGRTNPNDLLDRRDRLVDQLNQLIGVSVTDLADDSLRITVAGSGIVLLDGTLTTKLSATVNQSADTVDLATAAGTPLSPKSGALATTVEARNLATGIVKQTLTDLDTLARGIITEVNRLHAGGAGLSGYTSLTAVNAVSSAAVPLAAAGLAVTPVNGSFRVLVHDATGAVASSVTVPITAGTTTLDDVRAALDADPYLSASIAGGKLTISTAPGSTFAFAGDSSDTLLALGLNTFFIGSDANSIDLNPIVAADTGKIAAARADANGLVHAGDGSNALAIARLRTERTMSGNTLSFGDSYAGLVGRIGSVSRDAKEAVERHRSALELARNVQQQTAGVSTDEELISLTQSQQAYAAAARYITVIQSLLDALLAIV
jgi:flagellar hook-associated protein 1 FlgK